MTVAASRTVYGELSVRPVINAAGNATLLGGSSVSEGVRRTMEEANKQYVEMRELLEKSGEVVARILGAEAAYVTTGCAGALTLSAAAVMAGKDIEKIARLPRTTGMKNEILIQKLHRYRYDRCLTYAGAKLVEVGNEKGTTTQQLEKAIGPRTAAVHYFYPWQGYIEGTLTLKEVVDTAHGKQVPVIVDAAGQVYPTDHMCSFTRLGADLVCFGAKYFGAPHSTGIVCGKRELVEACALQGFIGFEETGARSIGRAMKVDRQEVVGVVASLKEWFSTNHEERLMKLDARVRTIMRDLRGAPNIKQLVPTPETGFATGLKVIIDAQALGKDADTVRRLLLDGTPRVFTAGWRADKETIAIGVHTLFDGEEKVVARRLREVLS